MDEESSFDLDAAGLRADGAELETAVEVLAVKLEGALPAETTVRRRARRLLSRDKVVVSIEVRLGDARYVLRVDGGEVEAERATDVRGVVIRREPLALEAWVPALTADLRSKAEGSAHAHEALQRLMG
ncbi:MAG: hypothetical protein LC685_05245 [Actinobacteria bacterium]|nr:hypothetical protein [Actinomycetota bacterium]